MARELRVGEVFEQRVVEDLTRTQIVMYAGASGDFHPLHSDERYARALGLPGVFAHGMLTMGLAGKALEAFVGAGRLLRYRARFLAQVWPGDTLVTRVEVTGLGEEAGVATAELAVSTRNQHGAEVLAGAATARLA